MRTLHTTAFQSDKKTLKKIGFGQLRRYFVAVLLGVD
jgi:hypothetical protein